MNEFMGSVSHGTMRNQDLINAFLDAISRIASRKPVGFNAGYASAAESQLINSVPAWVSDEGDDCPWWDGEDAGLLVEGLFDALGECAPDGYYFGSHPGDGSDYGFWEVENEF